MHNDTIMSETPTIAIIGPGRVGTSLGILAARAGYRVVAVGGRHKESAIKAAEQIGEGVCGCDMTEAAKSAQMVLLCVPDDAIEDVCGRLAQQKSFVAGTVVVHCSGALSSEILATARQGCGCSVGSMHPLQTFPTVDAALRLMSGSYCFYEGDKGAIAAIARFAADVGLIPVQITAATKTAYHAAAVMACNYLVSLMDASIMLAEEAGIDRPTACSALKHIAAATLNNVAEMGTAEALTGPIARGDITTIRKHLEQLESIGGPAISVYRTMGLYTLGMARAKGSIPKRQAAQIKDLLTG